MPKLKQTFVRGRMNKDIDERLLPKGEYVDAQNIQVSTSESGDVGAIETVLGNQLMNYDGIIAWDDNFGLTNAICIGGVRDTSNNKIYWFITADEADAIVEFDQDTTIVAPVLVDTNGVLNFDANYLITGVNILEGLLYWTDDLNEPKVINIATFKAGSAQGSNIFSVHTQVYGRDFIEKDITVITERPPQPLNAVAYASLVGGAGTGITPIKTNDSPGLAFQDAEAGDVRSVSWSTYSTAITWAAGSRAVFTAEIEQEDGSLDKYQVVGEFVSGINNATTANLTVESATPNIPSVPLSWNMLLIEDDPIFKNDFPRFSYRYKFTDGRYSTYAPFTLPAFVAGEFKYLSRDGNNEGMNSVIRKINISGFPTIPKNVEEVEVLYKGASSNNVYVIETFDYDDVASFDITSGVLGPVIESTQLLRLYDNVPQLAKSQEVVANRIVYGNYVQNYDVNAGSIRVDAYPTALPHSNTGFGIQSIKTDREYQLGVSFVDDYGRESPVFTSNSGAVSFNIENAKDVNKIEAVLPTASLPSWAEYFKYYIKNSTPEYYNLALDRYYDAEDGSVWLSFPSSERNKIKEGQYIILKKEHNSAVPVIVNNKYKVLSVSNDAPDFIKNINEVVGNVLSYAWMPSGDEGFIVGDNSIKFWSEVRDSNPPYYDGFRNGETLYFETETRIGRSSEYTIYSGGPVGSASTSSPKTINGKEYIEYEIILKEAIKTEDKWLENLPDEGAFFVVLQNKVSKSTPEFVGRFFTKITPNATFFNSIPSEFKADTVDYIEDKNLVPTLLGQNDSIARIVWKDEYQPPAYPNTTNYPPTANSTSGGLVSGQNNFNIFYQNGPNDSFLESFWTSLITPATKIKFTDSSGTIISDDFYTVIKSEDDNGDYGQFSTYTRFDSSGVPVGNTARWVKITLNRAWDDLPSDYPPAGIIIYREKIKTDTTLLSSTNPAIFETEPDELADLDIYWEASGLIPRSDAGNRNYYLNWYNCYSFGNGVESDRIRDDFNAPIMGKGVRVNAELQEPYKQERRASGLIYGGLYNSLSSVNNTNQFIAGVKITKDLDPQYGGVQKLHTRDTNLVAFAEDKVFRILADKDALYNADGNSNLTSTNRVLGDASTFAGEFGISKNPESFATYGFRAYFTDKSRGAVLRLSMDGITEISSKGMSDYFIDKFRTVNTPLIGSFDEDASSYNLAVGNESVSFKEQVDGWPTRLSYIPEFATSLNNEYYTFKSGEIYEHSNDADYCNFYGAQFSPSVELIFNDAPSSIKNFKTLAYEGSEKWVASINTDKQSGSITQWRENEGLYFNFIKGAEATWDNVTQTGTLNTKEFSVQGVGTITAALGGAPFDIEVGGIINTSLSIGDTLFIKRPAGIFKVGDVVDTTFNRITVNDPNNITPAVGEYAFFAKSNQINTSGLIGYYASVTLTTQASGNNELFGVSSEVFISSE